MGAETRTAVYDSGLRIEAFRFEGLARPFPNHFHEYYVIGFVEGGTRRLSCKNREYDLRGGDIVLFSPGDNHACVQTGEGTLDYRGLNIPKEVMGELAEEAAGQRALPEFSRNVIRDGEIACYLRLLHELVMGGSCELRKEESLLLLLSALLRRYSRPFAGRAPECPEEIEKACAFMEQHYGERICLDQICRQAGLSKSALLRAFTRAKGVTPYRYLENIRIGKAKKLLEQGALPMEATLATGFADQSHFTNYFTRFIGLSPGVYREIFWGRDGGEEKPHGS